MAIRIVQLGSPRASGEGTRIGTVRRVPRGVPKGEYAARHYFDTWLPELAPSLELMKQGLAAQDDKEWRDFLRAYRKEMSRPEAVHLLALLATLSKTTNLAVGCYCEDESRCHRSILRELLREHGAEIAA